MADRTRKGFKSFERRGFDLTMGWVVRLIFSVYPPPPHPHTHTQTHSPPLK